MTRFAQALALLLLLPFAACATGDIKHFSNPPRPGATTTPPLSSAVQVGKTLYLSGVLDMDPATGKPGTSAEESSRLALDSLKRELELAGYTMDDLVWVQIFCSDLTYYAAFNTIYRTYFHGDMPTRAFLGADHLLNGGHFEIMGVAAKK